MLKIWVIGISLYLIITFLFWRLTNDHFKKEFRRKMWKKWGTRLFYWQGVIYTGTGITVLIMLFLRWVNVLTF